MSVYKIIFSPTGGTKKVADIVANVFSKVYKEEDLTDRTIDFSEVHFTADDICIVAVPSYGGRVAATATKRLNHLTGGGAKAILVAVYGNRAYEDTFVELEDILTDAGFHCVAGIAAIAEHSIMRQFAAGRPDADDAKELTAFAEKIKQRIETGDLTQKLTLPGNRPYREYRVTPMIPMTGEVCSGCGLCAKECPVGAIPVDNSAKIDAEKCISCMRCVNLCPKQAREIAEEKLEAVTQKLQKVCAGHKENELFL